MVSAKAVWLGLSASSRVGLAGIAACALGVAGLVLDVRLYSSWSLAHPLVYQVTKVSAPTLQRRQSKYASELSIATWVRVQYQATGAEHDFSVENPNVASDYQLGTWYESKCPSGAEYENAKMPTPPFRAIGTAMAIIAFVGACVACGVASDRLGL